MKTKAAFVALLTLCCAQVFARGSAPLELKDIRVGESTMADVSARFPYATIVNPNRGFVLATSSADKKCGYTSAANLECRRQVFDDFRVAGALSVITSSTQLTARSKTFR